MDQCDGCKYRIYWECTYDEMSEEDWEAIEQGEECPYRKEPKMSYSERYCG